ncbi:30S ribosomal protein S20 [Candidatus Peregrinibacteria bacterium]|nr:30S ribosomal protein S20 [Candidatus Peregrinibacteria bacterium]
MPVTSSAIKASRQNASRRERLRPYGTGMKTAMRSLIDLVKANKIAEAKKMLPAAYKAIDTAAKKNIIHRNNAGRKKSLLARMVAGA